MLSEISQTQKDRYCVTPFISTETGSRRWGRGWGRGWGVRVSWGQSCRWLHSTVNVLNATELHWLPSSKGCAGKRVNA
ncbi:hypothetical protein Cadr_000025147 [Camelus dromedarius]|uniref:Uncharacterized protein n=1 Tax=Camelus dromedarius TaxID=9838 RepID=A0A5N4CNU5_CAMDR|nr:hypothetical protein Cadr_000025147 [Camelus dromedarius]